MKWIFQKESIGSDREKLQAACTRQGIPFVELEYYNPDYPWELFDVQGVCYGSINFCKYCYKYPVYPGPIATWKNYECTTYYSRLGKYLLNQNYMFLPWAEFKRYSSCFHVPYENMINNLSLFIRPNAGDKKFVGQVIPVHRSNIIESHVFDKIAIEEPEPDDLIVIAEPRNILAEYRFVIANKEVITGSRYKLNNQLSLMRVDKEKEIWNGEQGEIFCNKELDDDEQGCYSADAANLAREIAQVWQPDEIYTMDICKATGGYFLLELNAFSCSGFYDCDHDLIVQEVTKYAKTIEVPCG